MLKNLPRESKKVYIITVIRHGSQVIDIKSLTGRQNQDIITGWNPEISSHLRLFCGLFVPYSGKICALFGGFIPLEKIA